MMINVGGAISASQLTAVQEGDVQPNAVDLRIGKVLKILPNVFEIDNDNKKHRGSVEIAPADDGYWHLPEGHYEVVMENTVSVADNEAGWVITRSTLNRNGIFLTSGLYDTGYKGVMAACMHVSCGLAKIKPGTRIGQYICVAAESLHKYDGDYGHGKDHDKKYT